MLSVKDDVANIGDSITILNCAGHYVELGETQDFFFVDGKEVNADELRGLALQTRERQVYYG